MWLMLQQDKPDDYVIASGETLTIREFAETAFSHAGIKLQWQGVGSNETGIDSASGKVVLKINPRFYRPAEVEVLLGNPGKAERELCWKRKIPFSELVARMVDNDIALVNQEKR